MGMSHQPTWVCVYSLPLCYLPLLMQTQLLSFFFFNLPDLIFCSLYILLPPRFSIHIVLYVLDTICFWSLFCFFSLWSWALLCPCLSCSPSFTAPTHLASHMFIHPLHLSLSNTALKAWLCSARHFLPAPTSQNYMENAHFHWCKRAESVTFLTLFSNPFSYSPHQPVYLWQSGNWLSNLIHCHITFWVLQQDLRLLLGFSRRTEIP